ncbi:KAP family P-loop domain-containing protein [Fischerella thermalis CCMEE 5268]|uniref:KAP family P-loop domain-containing protein n=1 Tax=Fischerella thermalis CCMEE 5268 TaxID=2019662 RepID=A0A2N6KBP7_9CYAN|nr:ATP-binding protein [Fischerella thermalis]PLZ95952.1 KAP family P-loop domain-containing protein [Fischerella thermalis CCMEE 5268]
MATIDNIIKSEVNPFNLINIKPMNFWEEKQNPSLTVDSIHREVLSEIEEFLDLVMIDHRSRSILLTGDPGSGKSHLLGRLKQTLNSKAFFVYILCDWSDSGNIWRHVLRCTVDSLIQIPEQQQESQLILWLKSLSAFTKRNLKKRLFNDSIWELLLSDRQKFIKHLKETYKTARIYNPDIFFGVLHDLTNPELYSLACEWLRGDCLSEESMQALKVKYCIETEDEAKSILANFGRISTETQPIVLCFDNLDTMPKLPDSFLDIQSFFDVNTTIHGENLKNFLIIISVITNTWNRHINRIQPADRAGIHKLIRLKPITIEQAETIWAYLLKPLHQQANPRPESSIYPLKQNVLEQNFPSGKTYPRNVINLGLIEYQNYKISLLSEKKQNGDKEVEPELVIDRSAEFQLLWQQEFKKIQSKVGKISLLPGTDLIKMVQEVLEALQIQSIKPKLLKGKYASYSLSYQAPDKQGKVGIVWTEDANMTSFFHIMNACQKAIQENFCKKLYLIRISSVGNARLAGYKIYNQIFKGTNHHHIKPNLASVHYLAAYHSLVNSAIAQELVLGGNTITLQELQSLTRETKILNKCAFLQDLGIILQQGSDSDDRNGKKDLRPVKDFMLNLVKTQSYMGVATLISQSVAQFPEVEETDLQLLMDLLCQEQKVKIINPKAKLQDRLICLVNKI